MTDGPAPVARPPAAMLRDPGHCLALGAGSGLAARAPGTWGSLVGLVLFVPLAGLATPVQLGLVALLFVAGVPICARTARALGVHDHGAIVLDEVVGVMLTLSFCFVDSLWWLLAFVAFRFFDIVKPWPIRAVDRRVGGGLGIMLDDVLAAVYAIGVIKVFEYFS